MGVSNPAQASPAKMGRKMKKRLALLAVAALFAGCEIEVTQDTEVEYLSAPGTEDLGLPFSAAVRVDDTLYLSGALGNIPGTLNLAEGGIQGETRQTMENIKSTLESFGSSMDDVVKCTVFLADIGEWAAMNEVYVTYFDDKPARSAMGVNGLALGARVEIECIAVMDRTSD